MLILMQYFLPNAFMPRVSSDIFVQCVVVVVEVVVVVVLGCGGSSSSSNSLAYALVMLHL